MAVMREESGSEGEYVLKWLMWGTQMSMLQAWLRFDWTRCLSARCKSLAGVGYLSQDERKQTER